ncbi:MAG: histidine kinase [Gemmatimonadaceae bacterium]
MSRRVVWLQLLIGWFPLWALFTTVVILAHDASLGDAAFVALRMIAGAAALGIVVLRFAERHPWPRPVTVPFVATHVALAGAYSFVWLVINSVIESVVHGEPVITVGPGVTAYLLTGVWLYIMIAGVSYTTLATQRAALAEAMAAKSQLAALRSQLHPHFLFNALHSVVHLIPREPKRAALAAEQLAGLLRTTIEEDRDLVSVAEELAFVEKYLDLERMRFGDRLSVRVDVSDDVRSALIPTYALQTLVENAVRHGAAPRVDATEILVTGSAAAREVSLSVRDSGDGADVAQVEANGGTGIRRLRERLAALYGGEARLDIASRDPSGFAATLVLPRAEATE